jgi:hypothetical protein
VEGLTAGSVKGQSLVPRGTSGRLGAARARSRSPSRVFIAPVEGLAWHAGDQVSESIEMWIDDRSREAARGRVDRAHHGHWTWNVR